MKIASVIVARNEEKNLPLTILSLKKQTLPPELIVVVDDGSVDNTAKIAKDHGCYVISLPSHDESYVGRPELAERFNFGLRYLRDNIDVDYVLLLGADHPLPPNYIEALVKRMEDNPKIVVASGRIGGEPSTETAPRGSGRIVSVKFWREANNLQYPIIWGWEAWLNFKAMQMGYITKSFRDITTEIRRPTSISMRKAEYMGKGMYALGYDWKYVIARSFITFMESPRAGFKMFWGWLRHQGVIRSDVADWVNKMQKKMFWKRVLDIIKHGGRKWG
jgi:glycosyltransferase involved in cell wall biosynthesis